MKLVWWVRTLVAVDMILIYTCTVEQELIFVEKKWYLNLLCIHVCLFVYLYILPRVFICVAVCVIICVSVCVMICAFVFDLYWSLFGRH